MKQAAQGPARPSGPRHARRRARSWEARITFWLSKIAGALLTPSTLLMALALVAWLAARRLTRRARALRAIAGGAVVLLLLTSFTGLSHALLAPLERRHAPLPADAAYDGVLVLGGAIGARDTVAGLYADLGEAADRVRLAAALARRRPDVPVVVAGGDVWRRNRPTEAALMRDLLVELGVPRERILLEETSRTTAENAAGAAALLGERKHARWALVTSAFHMPRAMGAFRRAGFSDLVAAPGDWRADPAPDLVSLDAPANLARLDLAAKEYLGLVGYAAMDKR